MTRIPHLLLGGDWETLNIDLDATAIHHLRRVLRLEDGHAVTYTDGIGALGTGVLAGETVLRGDEHRVDRPTPHLTMAVAPPRVADRARMVVEKLAELGVDRLLWLKTVRGEGRPPRGDRSEAWARAALEQSRGAWVLDIRSGERPEGPWPGDSRVVVCDRSGKPARDLGLSNQPVLGLVGPEGGFVPGELPEPVHSVSLGGRVLRVETAAIALAAIVRVPGLL